MWWNGTHGVGRLVQGGGGPRVGGGAGFWVSEMFAGWDAVLGYACFALRELLLSSARHFDPAILILGQSGAAGCRPYDGV